jgi:predicted DNA-binding transcriptional regulator YafY
MTMDRLERLLNLVIALRETRQPLEAADIRTRVAGYGQPDAAAFRRMFERDKADLRVLGVPIETAPLDRWGDDRVGYRIDPKAYDLPPLDLAPEELLALALAVDATGLSDGVGSALRKLEVDADVPGLTRGAGGAGGLDAGLDAPHLAALSEAQLTRTQVRFDYRTATGSAGTRTVDPHALVHRGGRWYVVAHDHDRAAVRAFRLDRITGEVTAVGRPGAFAVPTEPVDVDAVVPAAPADGPATAVVAVAPDSAWQVARSARGEGEPTEDGWTRFTVAVGDPESFVGWALGRGDEIEVIAPADLRMQVVGALREAAAGGWTA